MPQSFPGLPLYIFKNEVIDVIDASHQFAILSKILSFSAQATKTFIVLDGSEEES